MHVYCQSSLELTLFAIFSMNCAQDGQVTYRAVFFKYTNKSLTQNANKKIMFIIKIFKDRVRMRAQNYIEYAKETEN